MVAVEVKNLVKRYGAVQAVGGISFEIEKGTLKTLLGPSGCGKTSTLRCIAGLEDLDGGEILLDGKLVASQTSGVFVHPEARGLGMVFQSYAVWPHMTVAENIMFPLDVLGLPRMEKIKRVREVLKQVGLGDKEERDATLLSGGEQQRVALARALVQNPKIILFDEPLSNLDAKLRREMRGEIKSLQKTLGMTALYVTHDQEEALFLSDEIALMEHGRIVDEGSPYEVYENSRTFFSMNFMGQCNIWNVVVKEVRDGVAIVEGSLGAKFESPAPRGVTAGMTAWLAVRPHHVESFVAPASPMNRLQGRLVLTSFLGNYFEYRLETEVGPLILHSQRPLAKSEDGSVSLFLPKEYLRLYPQDAP